MEDNLDQLEVPVSIEDTNILKRFLGKVVDHIKTIKSDIKFEESNRRVEKLNLVTDDENTKKIILTINEIIDVLRLD